MSSASDHCLMFAWKMLMFLMVFLNLWIIFDREVLPPDGNLFHLLILFILAHFLDQVSDFCQLPPLLGMLVAGFIHGNVTNAQLDKTLTSTIRSLALIIILIRAGLNLDPEAIRRLSLVCLRLSLLPSILEAITIAIFAWFVFGLNVIWSLMLGFVIGSVSPAVVVPSMVKIQEEKLGTKKGIPTLLIASASVDNVFAITGVSVCLSVAFADQNSNNTWNTVLSILRGPLEALAGVLIGVLVGVILWYLPEQYYHPKAPKHGLHRFVLLMSTSLFTWFGSKAYDFKSVGPLAILTAPFVASTRWRLFNLGKFSRETLKILWMVFENLLFCLIGSSVRLKDMKTSVLLYGTICILIGVLIRMMITYLITFGKNGGFNRRESLFMSIAWLPKATIQAAMGPIALDSATNDEQISHGHLILTLAVLSILMTAPFGAIAIDKTYRFLLGNDDEANDSKIPSDQTKTRQSVDRQDDDAHQLSEITSHATT